MMITIGHPPSGGGAINYNKSTVFNCFLTIRSQAKTFKNKLSYFVTCFHHSMLFLDYFVFQRPTAKRRKSNKKQF